jgi:hypothetical protein
MARLGERLRTLADRLWRGVFPPEVQLPDEARRTLAALYPSLDLDRVRFHRGLPHLLKGVGDGITLPGALSVRLCRIYVEPLHWRPETPDGLDLLAHEAFHALQMQETGRGLGLVRPFVILYLACAAGNGFRYSGHPMEDDAYCVAGRSYSHFLRICGCGGAPEEIAVETSGVAFWRRLTASVPGGRFAPWALVWLLAWTGATAVLWLLWLATVGVGGLAAGLVWSAGRLLSWLDPRRLASG